MAVYYVDTSAVVKRYAQEIGTSWMSRLADPLSGHDLYTVRLTGPEAIAAIFRKVRTGELVQADATRAAHNFRTDWQHHYHVVDVSVSIADHAMALAERHGLRGYDAVHVATALELHTLRQAMSLPSLVFVSADSAQLLVAQAEGMQIENPAAYP